MNLSVELYGLFHGLYLFQHLFPALRPLDGLFPVKGAQLFDDRLLVLDFLLLV